MNIYDLDYYDYDLPEDRIAQTPLKDRSSSKLLVMDKTTGELKDRLFSNILDMLSPNDVLVLNDTKVIPARLVGIKQDTGALIELLLLKNTEKDYWECLSKPAKRLCVGTIIRFGEGILKAKVLEKKEDGIIEVELLYNGVLYEILDTLGSMPLPPYIHEKLREKDRYQTVYAKYPGSAAAPTAGLHFTNELLEKLKEKGVTICYVTLHVGLGTFRPVKENNLLKHKMHEEYYHMDKETAKTLNEAKKQGKRIIAVGTTSTRTLESIMSKYNTFKEVSENTNIFIYPGYEFKAIDGLITNFHLPKSTLVMLVSAFSTRDNILKAYKYAIKKSYRFFSFGDAMFIINKIK